MTPEDTQYVYAAYNMAIGALTDAVEAHTKAIRCLAAAAADKPAKRRWWRL